jgi:hypothetical protein
LGWTPWLLPVSSTQRLSEHLCVSTVVPIYDFCPSFYMLIILSSDIFLKGKFLDQDGWCVLIL